MRMGRELGSAHLPLRPQKQKANHCHPHSPLPDLREVTRGIQFPTFAIKLLFRRKGLVPSVKALFLWQGLNPAHRAVFMTGVMAYVSAPLWFLSLVASTAFSWSSKIALES